MFGFPIASRDQEIFLLEQFFASSENSNKH
jgi:hypothetical protein